MNVDLDSFLARDNFNQQLRCTTARVPTAVCLYCAFRRSIPTDQLPSLGPIILQYIEGDY